MKFRSNFENLIFKIFTHSRNFNLFQIKLIHVQKFKLSSFHFKIYTWPTQILVLRKENIPEEEIVIGSQGTKT